MVDWRRRGPPGLQTRRAQVVGLQVGGVLPDRHQALAPRQDPRHGQAQDRGQVMTHAPPVPRIGHIPKNLPQGLARQGTRGGRWHSGATPRDRGLIRHRLSSRRGRAAPPSTRRKPRTSDNRPPTLPTPWGRGWSRRTRSGAGRPRRGRSGPPRLMLEVLLWLLGRYSEQGVMLHVCCKVLQGRPFGMSSLKVGARRALRAVGGAWRDSATMCYSGPGAGRSGGVLPGPVALRALEVASYRHSRRQGSGSTTHL